MMGRVCPWSKRRASGGACWDSNPSQGLQLALVNLRESLFPVPKDSLSPVFSVKLMPLMPSVDVGQQVAIGEQAQMTNVAMWAVSAPFDYSEKGERPRQPTVAVAALLIGGRMPQAGATGDVKMQQDSPGKLLLIEGQSPVFWACDIRLFTPGISDPALSSGALVLLIDRARKDLRAPKTQFAAGRQG
ncbi:hypothetical protein ASPVEDRAFT_401343 [Aspergillus versicolor CBS 583.65]|uniref:Uncharacterized protein n=1 Tax=Aspergillus versicolor CBS 583.65 TaxID=1036611 RepID=A0A1L9Q411_ASPVE|nr:uncharacterized protein ASPVEDRAFT_401343 [Aspergillus versicolor CBS 583.65]OJJ08462.1 hypothetical protein ASPVEDRAFT_401343 [Aspergillus versicolor CBS 583.65]